MTKIPKDGLRPSPVYEAHMSDGEIVRLSFYSPAGKPIDMDAGRRAAEAIMCGLPVSETTRHPVRLMEYKNRPKAAGAYTAPVIGPDRAYTSHRELASPTHPFARDVSGAWARPVPRDPTKRVVRAYVSHPTIGRVEHVPGMNAAPVKPKHKALGKAKRELDWQPLRDMERLGGRARAFALILVDEFSRDKIDAQLVAQAVIGLREALKDTPR